MQYSLLELYIASAFSSPSWYIASREREGGWVEEKHREKSNLKGYYPSQMLWVINRDLFCWALLGVRTALALRYMALISRSLDNL